MEELLSGFLLEEHYGRFVKLTKRITDFNNDKELKRLDEIYFLHNERRFVLQKLSA